VSRRRPRFRGSNGSRSNNLGLVIILAFGSGRRWSHLVPVVGERQQNVLRVRLIIGQPRLPAPRPLDEDLWGSITRSHLAGSWPVLWAGIIPE
jgi:hypothetical protein